MYNEAIKILIDDSCPNYISEASKIQLVLEDVNSPVTRKYQEKLYQSVINKAHIDFGDIPKSEGNIRNYKGYNNMMETIDVIEKLAIEEKANDVIKYVKILRDAINNIDQLSSTYNKGFITKTEYVAMEYDTYVYFCIEATTALIYSFVEVVKAPDKNLYEMKIKNSKLRADEFYFEQLEKFNRVQNKSGIDYRKMLETMCDKGKSNFTGAEVLGVAAVVTVAMSIVPITREIIYQIYNFRGKLSDNLEMQAHFLELNKVCVENNEMMDAKKREKVAKKQLELSKKLLKLSDTIRVKSSKSIMDSKRELKSDNKMLTLDNIKDEVSNSPLELF